MRYCTGTDEEPRDTRVGVAFAYSQTHLELTTNGRTDEASFAKAALLASLDRRLGERWTLGGAVGSNLTGAMEADGARFRLSPGPMAVLVASFRPVDEGSVRPFVLFTGAFGTSLLWTMPEAGGGSTSMLALDGRLGIAAGKTIAGVATPYVLARAFGGPVFWTNQNASSTGTDAYHYQLGAGLAVRLGAFDAVAEGVPLGEKALVAGAGWAF